MRLPKQAIFGSLLITILFFAHRGNKRFRDIVALHRPDYTRAPKIQKPSVARVIVRAIRNGDPPGRFLKKDEKTGRWYDIGDKKAAEKTSQALREKTNEERDKLKGDAASLGVQVLLPNPTSYLAAVSGAPLVLPGMQQPLMVPPTDVSAGVAQNEKEKEEASAAENSQEDSKPAAVEGISAEAVAATAADVAATAAETIANVSDATNDALVAEETSRLVPAVANPVAHSAEVTAQEAVSAAAETTEDIAQAAVAAATAAADEAAKASMEQIETTSV